MQHHYLTDVRERVNVYDVVNSTCEFNCIAANMQSHEDAVIAHIIIGINTDSPRVLLHRRKGRFQHYIDELDINYSSVNSCIIDKETNFIECNDECLISIEHPYGHINVYDSQLVHKATLKDYIPMSWKYKFKLLSNYSIAIIDDLREHFVKLFDVNVNIPKNITALDESYKQSTMMSTNENTLYLFSKNDAQGYVIDFRNKTNSRISMYQFSQNPYVQRITDTHIIFDHHVANQTREIVLYDTRNDQYLNLYTWAPMNFNNITPYIRRSMFTAY